MFLVTVVVLIGAQFFEPTRTNPVSDQANEINKSIYALFLRLHFSPSQRPKIVARWTSKPAI